MPVLEEVTVPMEHSDIQDPGMPYQMSNRGTKEIQY
jgi:hypothetical protein